MQHFHAHLYFEARDLALARTLAQRARSLHLFEFIKLHEKPVGPHPTGMIEVHFNDLTYAAALEWLEAHHGRFSTLIHHDSGDDVRDHTEGIRWLGKAVPLDFSFFELIKSRPQLRVHQ